MTGLLTCALGILIGFLLGVTIATAGAEMQFDEREERRNAEALRRIAEALERLTDDA